MPNNDSITNNPIKYPYIMKQPNQQPIYKVDWEKALKSPIDFSFKVPTSNIETPINLEGQAKIQETKTPNIPTTYTKNFDVTENMYKGSVEDLNKCLEGTKLAGKGQMFLDAQEKYGINAIFLMSIVKEESAYGAAPAKERNGKVHKYNIAGLTTGKKTPGHKYQDNASYEACIESLCKNLHKHYIKRNKTTIAQIQSIYAPGNEKWATKIKNTMGEISKEIMSRY